MSGSQDGKREWECLEKVLLFLAYFCKLVRALQGNDPTEFKGPVTKMTDT